ncbi:MAG: ArsA family ATPase [Candidatus Hodarchaeales archaeon]|jgi:arsenite-transporting ATPase
MPLLTSESLRDRRIIATGGKGGVGKTTVAASLALYFAEKEEKETLVISSDPTPSLSDILECSLCSSRPTAITKVPRLHALEMAREEVVKSWKERFGNEIYEVISSYIPVGYEIIDYIAEAPGIVDDQYMLAYLLDIAEGDQYDKIIWDTAPAGQTLSILKLESRFYEHLNQAAHLFIRVKTSFDKMTSKLRKKRSPLEIINEWRELANYILNTIRDPSKVEFVLVTIPEGLGVAQTERVTKELLNYGIQVRHLVINNVLPDGDDVNSSPFLRSRQAVQQPYLKELDELFEQRTTTIPMLPLEVKGLDPLREIGSYLAGTS